MKKFMFVMCMLAIIGCGPKPSQVPSSVSPQFAAASKTKADGEYVSVTLPCMEKQSPDLAVLLRNIYATAKKHEEKHDND